MYTIFAAFLLLVCTMSLFIAPLLPALIELRRKRDAEPLRVIPEYDVDVHSFADNFKDYLQAHYHGAFVHCADRPEPFYGTDREGKDYILLSEEEVVILSNEKQNQFTQRIFLGCGSLRLPGGMSYLSEIYARGSVYGGEADIYRAILADENLHVNVKSMLLRWCHAGGDVFVDRDCVLHGRVSADKSICLSTDCRFERLFAPTIQFLGEETTIPASHKNAEAHAAVTEQNDNSMVRRWLYQRDVVIPDGAIMDADIVVTGTLRIGADVRIDGSVKSHGDIHVGGATSIYGSLITEQCLHIGSDCLIKGPVIAEKDIYIDSQSQIGFEDILTTVNAQHIYVSPGVVCHGTVWAHNHGVVREMAINSNEAIRRPG